MKTALSALLALLWISLPSMGAEAPQWVEQKNPEFLAERYVDGDSFGMTVESPKRKRVKRTYRLYGADSPECDVTNKLLKERIEEQAAYFGIPEQDIPAWGKKATEFTEKLVKEGKPRVLTCGYMGEKTRKAGDRHQRYYALVEVTAPDGKRRWLHELLLEAGLARAHGVAAAWPEKEVKRLGESKAKERFMRDLGHLESKAKRDGIGIWKKAPAGRFR